jgi:hypothetical protein
LLIILTTCTVHFNLLTCIYAPGNCIECAQFFTVPHFLDTFNMCM